MGMTRHQMVTIQDHKPHPRNRHPYNHRTAKSKVVNYRPAIRALPARARAIAPIRKTSCAVVVKARGRTVASSDARVHRIGVQAGCSILLSYWRHAFPSAPINLLCAAHPPASGRIHEQAPVERRPEHFCTTHTVLKEVPRGVHARQLKRF